METTITIGEYFERIENGETNKAIAKSIGRNVKALNRALQRASYEYSKTTRKWEYTGEGEEPLTEQLIFLKSGQRLSAITSTNPNTSTTTRTPANKGTRNNTNTRASEDTNNSARDTTSNGVRDTTNSNVHNSDSMDIFDRLLSSEPKSKPKGYRGVYFSPEVNNVLDQIESGRRSEFIDECVKKVLKEKGLL